ncbi:M20/M25/M40 family metallo-hydrolase [Filibacter tadaridae]|uniref:Aminopeptidase YwaD n=1 Tax=Filibacter tadaridae TaxID=2483811 RepID=A0A3P5X4V2_9BACL|nr:M20/M25/M40 family metallo-hydrolase [Filibacter tadaridae]VDC25506.1 Aminopeptidase YwaD precursor [Filibacter tadaridae]
MNYKKSLLFFIFLLAIPLAACSQKETVVEMPKFNQVETGLLNGLDVEKIYGSIDELTQEPRVAGTKSEQNAATFLTNHLEAYGYDVTEQPFTFERYVAPETFSITIEGLKKPLTSAPFQYSVSGDVTGELVDVGKGRQSDYKGIDVVNKIVLARVSDLYFSEMVLYAAEAGAAAILIHFPEEESIDTWSLGEHNDSFIPALALSAEEGAKLVHSLKKSGPVTATVKIEGAVVKTDKSQNIVVTKSPVKKSDDIVIIGAHYDSVDKAPGASDNASGTAVVLELARMYKDIPTDKEIRFLFFGAEEEGLNGSEKYVDTMKKDEIKNTVAMFNLDMVGSAEAGGLAFQTVDGVDNTVTKYAGKAQKKLTGKSTKTDFGDRSDHTPFHEAGIDAALFIYDPVEKWYHSPEDTIEKLSKERLLTVAKIVGTAVLDLTYQSSERQKD